MTAASSSVSAAIAPAFFTISGSPPRKQTTVGFPLSLTSASTFSATSGAGGLETRRMIFDSGSAWSALKPSLIIMPPTATERSRPPVPMAWVMPTPARAI